VRNRRWRVTGKDRNAFRTLSHDEIIKFFHPKSKRWKKKCKQCLTNHLCCAATNTTSANFKWPWLRGPTHPDLPGLSTTSRNPERRRPVENNPFELKTRTRYGLRKTWPSMRRPSVTASSDRSTRKRIKYNSSGA